jgi:hypothetical protein
MAIKRKFVAIALGIAISVTQFAQFNPCAYQIQNGVNEDEKLVLNAVYILESHKLYHRECQGDGCDKNSGTSINTKQIYLYMKDIFGWQKSDITLHRLTVSLQKKGLLEYECVQSGPLKIETSLDRFNYHTVTVEGQNFLQTEYDPIINLCQYANLNYKDENLNYNQLDINTIITNSEKEGEESKVCL